MARTTGSHADITGPKIRRAAEKLFAREGYAAVSMRQIAKAVGLQVGALYNYTPDKQTLLFDLMRGHLKDLLEARGAAMDDTGPVCARLRSFVQFHIQYHHDRPDAVFVAYMELRNLTPQNFVAIEQLRRAYEHELEQIIRDGVTEGVFYAPDPKIATYAIIAMLTGVTTWFRADGRLGLAKVQEQYWQMTQKALRVGHLADD